MFKEINVRDHHINAFRAIGEKWMLVTAGDQTAMNTMTASWGGVGVLWNKDVVTCYIRPQRYTREFLDAHELFSVGFFPPQYRDKLTYCGIVSGRKENKIARSGLTPCFDYGAPCFEESSMVLICRKLYVGAIQPEHMLSPEIDSTFYAEKDYHLVYIGEIVKALTR